MARNVLVLITITRRAISKYSYSLSKIDHVKMAFRITAWALNKGAGTYAAIVVLIDWAPQQVSVFSTCLSGRQAPRHKNAKRHTFSRLELSGPSHLAISHLPPSAALKFLIFEINLAR
jgi:hypothetical protein